MRTNCSARSIKNLQVTMLCLAIAALAGVECRIGESLASRFGQVTASRSDSPQAPSVDISNLMLAAR
jgi:hypothetical protein